MPSFSGHVHQSTALGNQCSLSYFGGRARVFIFFFLLTPLFWVVLPQASYGQRVAQEYELKAVYLYNFLQFVQWPESPILKDGPMVIGIVGDSPFGAAFEELQKAISRGGKKPVRIVYYGSYHEGLDMTNCHILFISASEKNNFGKIVAELRGRPVLTVADTGDFLSSGGMINLVRSGGKIRWTINRPQADKAGLRLSAQLLTLAVKVVEKG